VDICGTLAASLALPGGDQGVGGGFVTDVGGTANAKSKIRRSTHSPERLIMIVDIHTHYGPKYNFSFVGEAPVVADAFPGISQLAGRFETIRLSVVSDLLGLVAG